MIGHVTSSYWSATLGHPIALALLRDGRARIGDVLYVPNLDGRNHAVRVTPPSFVGKEAVDG
jgi:sarcosine oxidase subunit alpha